METLEYETEYNVRLLHRDRAALQARGSARSRRAYREMACIRDVRYGSGPRALLDLFPAANGARGDGVPLVVFFHGGYWHAHERCEYAFVARAFAGAGIWTALAGYDLAPAARIAVIVAQAREACEWLRANAVEIGVDPAKIFTAGHSAGAHLAACALTERASGLEGAILLSGIYDLVPLLGTSLNRSIRLTASTARRWSPARHSLPATGDALLAVGAFETTEFVRQSREFAIAWRAEGRSSELMVVPATHHYGIVLELGEADSALSRAARNFVLRRSSRVALRQRRSRG